MEGRRGRGGYVSKALSFVSMYKPIKLELQQEAQKALLEKTQPVYSKSRWQKIRVFLSHTCYPNG